MSVLRQAIGVKGERIAEKWLVLRGWDILDRRFRNGHRDIDIVAARQAGPLDARLVAFIEVKTRTGVGFGGPTCAVDWRKQRELTRSAKVWIARNQRPADTFRFDVIGVLFGPGGVRVQHVENAFRAR